MVEFVGFSYLPFDYVYRIGYVIQLETAVFQCIGAPKFGHFLVEIIVTVRLFFLIVHVQPVIVWIYG